MHPISQIITDIIERDQKYVALEQLCGNMLATLVISRNRDRMRDGDSEAIESLIALSDRWATEFDKITGRSLSDAAKPVPSKPGL